MRRILALLLAASLVLTSSSLAPVAEASGTWTPPLLTAKWVTRGMTYQRNAVTDVEFGYLGAYPAWQVNLGVSASQPVNIENRIYHLAGNNLWEIDLTKLDPGNPDPYTNPGVRVLRSHVNDCVRGTDGRNVCPDYDPKRDPEAESFRPSTSGITFAEVDGVGVLYYGTGSNEVCGTQLREIDGRFPTRCWPLGGEQPIASTPLVLKMPTSSGVADITIIGDKAGGLWAVQGLSGFGVLTARRYELGQAWITPSPAATGNPGEFIWGADGVGMSRGNGVFAKFRVQPADPATGQELRILDDKLDPAHSWFQFTGVAASGGGIADGFVVQDGYVYFADKQGDLFKVNINQPHNRKVLEWRRVFPHYDGVFINQIPAVDEAQVYFSVRFVNTGVPGNTGRGGDGALVAVNKDTWEVAWVSPVFGGANTMPLVLTKRGAVVVGTMNGSIISRTRTDGSHDYLASTESCSRQDSVALLSGPERPYRARYPYQQLNGVGTDPALVTAEGRIYLVSGVNFWVDRDADNVVDAGESGGRLVGYLSGGTYNVAVSEMTIPGVTTPSDARTGVVNLMPKYAHLASTSEGAVARLSADQEYEVHTTVDAEGLENPRTVGVLLFYVNKDGTYSRLVDHTLVRFSPGHSTAAVVSRFKFEPADPKNGYLVALANPESMVFTRTYESEFLLNSLSPYLPQSVVQRAGRDITTLRTMSDLAEYKAGWDAFAQWLRENNMIAVNTLACGEFIDELEIMPLRTTDWRSGMPVTNLITLSHHYDNVRFIEVERHGPDLVLAAVDAPTHADYNAVDSYRVEFTVNNTYKEALSTDWRATMDGQVIATGVGTWNPGTAGNTVSFVVRITGPDRVQSVLIEVNPGRVVEEEDYSNNSKTVRTSISPVAKGRAGKDPTVTTPPPIWEGSDDEATLVPRDCSPNDDPTDKRPCLNYGQVVSPWYCANYPGAPECRGYTPGGVWYRIDD